MCQISRQSDNAFAFYSSFCKCAKRGRKIRRKKTKKLSQFVKSHISEMPEAISLKFGMWSAEGGGNLHSKICLVSSRQHRATEVRKLRFLSSCQYTHGVARRLLGPHDTLLCVLISCMLGYQCRSLVDSQNYYSVKHYLIPKRCISCVQHTAFLCWGWRRK